MSNIFKSQVIISGLVCFGFIGSTFLFLDRSVSQATMRFYFTFQIIFGFTALVSGVIAFIQSYGKKSRFFLFLAIGLFSTAIIDCIQALAPFSFLELRFTENSETLLAWGGFISRLNFAAITYLSLKACKVETEKLKECRSKPKNVLAIAGVAIVGTLVFVVFNAIPYPYLSSFFTCRPLELFAAALLGFSSIRLKENNSWNYNNFEYWLRLSVSLALVGQLFLFFSSKGTFNLGFQAANLFKWCSYLILTTGLLIRIYHLLNQAQRSAQNLSWANEEVRQEIEERKWTEQLLQETRLFAESIVESIREPILVLDSELHIIRANRSFYATFNLKPERTLKRCLNKLGQGEWDDPDLHRELRRIIPEGSHFENYEMTRDFKGIGLKTILLNALRINQKDVETNLILLAMYDITERKIAQEQARRLAHGVESAAESIMMTDLDGVIQYINPAFTTLTGYTSEDLIGKKLDIFASKIHSETFCKNMWDTILSGKVWSGEVTNKRKDGTLYEVYLTVAPVLDNRNKLEGFVSVQNDITELKRTKEELARRADELARSNAELEQFAYIASHDLQEPLRMISSYCQLLQRRYMDRLDNDANDFIEYAVDGAKRMQALINDLLEYSRVGTRGQAFRWTDCSEVLNQALDNLKMSIEECGAKIKSNALPTTMADETQLVQLFQNLIGNAIKFKKDGAPEIHIKSERKNGQWRFSIKDNGIGMEEDYAERIFVIFQRLHNNGKYPGTGIGLAICKKIVERHRGRIWVNSQLGKGSTFYFTLPRVGELQS